MCEAMTWRSTGWAYNSRDKEKDLGSDHPSKATKKISLATKHYFSRKEKED